MKTKSRNSQPVELLHQRVSSSITDDAILNYLSSLDTPRSLAVWLLYSLDEHDQLSSLEISPLDYVDSSLFRLDYLATNFLAKSDFLHLLVSKKEAAMKKFLMFEELCGKTNSRFRFPLLDSLTNESSSWLLNATKRKIESILGEFSADEFVDRCNWGPGVSTLLKGEEVSAYNKFQSETGITRDLHAFIKPWFSMAYPLCHLHLTSQGRVNDGFTYEVGNVVVTVPKNSKTDRVIAIEPGWNLWFQKGLGAMIRRRLGRFGVDLNNQGVNQHYCCKAAVSGHLATVDFSSASDSISTEVVRELLPPRWFSVLDVARSKFGRNGTDAFKWKKFSSMGNGFTFELESLIFFSAAHAVCDLLQVSCFDISVYGDDVIIPVEAFPLYSEFCAFLGFLVNRGKSFSSGYFRESCGSHYFEELDCKPVYLKGKLTNPQSVYKLANAVRLVAHRFGNKQTCDRRFLRCWRFLYKVVPKPLRFGIPLGYGDGGFVMNFDEATPPLAKRPHELTWEGYSIMVVAETGVTRFCEGPGLLMDRVRGGQALSQGNSFVLRGRTKVRIMRIFVPS